MNRLVLIAPFTLLAACDNGTGSNGVDYTPLLATLTDGVAVPAIAAFTTNADALVPALTALETMPTAASLSAAQAAWRVARASWRKLDTIGFGPVADDGIAARIDVAPADSAGIDATVNGTQTLDKMYVGASGGKQKGFLGIEHLLFSANGADAALASLTGDGAAARRRTFARAMAEEVAASAHQLKDAWDPAQGGYATQVKTAGAGSTVFSHGIDAISQYAGKVAYALELVVGVRMGEPLGRKSTGVPDPSQDPTSASDSATADMTATLEGVRALWSTPGFASYVSASAVRNEAETQQSDCIAQVSSIPAPYATALTAAAAPVQVAYNSCKVWKKTWDMSITQALGVIASFDGDGD